MFICVCCGRECQMRTSREDVCHPCQYECGVDYCLGTPGHDTEAKERHCREVWKKAILEFKPWR